MSQRHVYILAHETARRLAVETVKRAPDGMVVEVRSPKRNDQQNRLLHAALHDIAEQVTWHGQKFDVETWKRLCTAAWLRERGGNPQMVPALDGHGFDIVYSPTSKLTKGEFSELCEWIYSFGVEHDVKFKEPTR